MTNRIFLSLFIVSWTIFSCQKDTYVDRNYELFKKYAGKYSLRSAMSDSVISLSSKDMIPRRNLFMELPDLDKSVMYITINQESMFFQHFWTEQSLHFPSKTDTIVAYSTQVTIRKFEVSHESDTLIVSQRNYNPNFPPPILTVFKEDGVIEMIFERKLKTSKGLKKVRITTLYVKDREYKSIYK